MVVAGFVILTVGLLLLWAAVKGENPVAALRDLLAGQGLGGEL